MLRQRMFIDQRNSIYVGHLGPIPLFLHWSFAILLFNAYRWSSPGGFDMQQVLIFTTVLLAGIVLHEMGHGMAARIQGNSGVKITLWAMGGLCHSRGDSLPRREIIILVAGPAVSFALAWGSWLALTYLAAAHPEMLTNGERPSLLLEFLDMSYRLNLLMGIFNITPIYPLDGGQIVHNVLRLFMRDYKANQVTLMVAVVTAVAYLAWNAQAYGQVDTYLLVLMVMLLYNAFTYLR